MQQHVLIQIGHHIFCLDSSKSKLQFHKLASVSTFLVPLRQDYLKNISSIQVLLLPNTGRSHIVLDTWKPCMCNTGSATQTLDRLQWHFLCEDTQTLLSLYYHLLPVRVVKGQKQNFLVHLFEERLLLLLRLVQAGQKKQKTQESSKVGEFFTNKQEAEVEGKPDVDERHQLGVLDVRRIFQPLEEVVEDGNKLLALFTLGAGKEEQHDAVLQNPCDLPLCVELILVPVVLYEDSVQE